MSDALLLMWIAGKFECKECEPTENRAQIGTKDQMAARTYWGALGNEKAPGSGDVQHGVQYHDIRKKVRAMGGKLTKKAKTQPRTRRNMRTCL
jgi:hypothetical protein